MPQPLDPFPIYKDGQSRVVHGVDYAGWADQGWTLEPSEPEAANPEPSEPNLLPDDPTVPTTYAARQAELEAMLKEDQGWRNIGQLAKDLGIAEKPAGGWADAIPLILEKEGFTP